MVRRRFVRSLWVSVALLAALLPAAGPVMAADGACSVSVDPRAAAGGAVLTFSGAGFKPSQLLLQKGDGSPTVNDIDVGDNDPWQQNVQSRAGDEGAWTATFVAEGGCSVSVQFQVTLASTDMISDLLPSQPASSLPTLYYLLVVGFGLAGGAFLSRRLSGARSGLRH